MPTRRWSPRVRSGGLFALVAAMGAVPAAAYVAAAGVEVMPPAWFHVALVGVAGSVALGCGLALSLVAGARDDGRGVLLGAAFAVMAVLLLLHGLSTPGVLVGDNGLVRLAGAVNLPAGAVILGASALPALRRPRSARLLLRVELVALALLLAAGAAIMADPAIIPALPEQGSLAAALVFAGGAACFGLLGMRAMRTWSLSRRPADLAVAAGAVCLIGALWGLVESPMMELGFWLAHALEVAGIALVGVPAALDLRHEAPTRPLVGDLSATDLVRDEERYLGAQVRALMVRLGTEDPSTEGHTRRVAALAVELGEHLGLPGRRLRLLALGGLLHDMGKLRVPREVLEKPGRLDPDERAVIELHPGWGRELLLELGGFDPLVHELVEHHHERMDATGYPGRVAAATLPLEVRLLTVADVYDALTADRPYRAAWSQARALALLDEEAGTAFDPTCVAALNEVLAARAPVAAAVAAPVPVGVPGLAPA